MDISAATTESHERFLKFSATFNIELKVAVAAFSHVERLVGEEPAILRQMIDDVEQRWGSNVNTAEPAALLQQVAASSCMSAIVQLAAAVDVFLETLEGDWDRAHRLRKTLPPPDCSVDAENTHRLEFVCLRRGWCTAPFDLWRPVLQYFHLARHCIVHRLGLASRALAEVSQSSDLKQAVAGWLPKRSDAGTPPELPEFEEGERLHFEPVVAIFGLDAIHRACAHVNKELVRALGPQGLTILAAYYSLLEAEPLVPVEAYRSPEAVINATLTKWYHARIDSEAEAASILRELGLWQRCVVRHKAIHGQRVRERRTKLEEKRRIVALRYGR